MTLAATVERYLYDHDVAFDVIKHPNTVTALRSARAGGVPADRVAKAVVLKSQHGFTVAVLPASHRVQMVRLRELLDREVDLANEEEIEPLFVDCDPGAVPPVGSAYGLKTIVDESLDSEPEIYFEGGDHESLVHVSGRDFRHLMAAEQHGRFTDESPPSNS